MLLTIKSTEINLAKFVPLTGRDWRELEREGVYFGLRPVDKNGAAVPGSLPLSENVMRMVLYVARKAEPSLTMEDMDLVPMVQIVEASGIIQSMGKPDDPKS